MQADFVARLGSRASDPAEVSSGYGIAEYVGLMTGAGDVDAMLRRTAYDAAPALRRLDPERLLALVQEAEPTVRGLLLVGHNPGFEELTEALAVNYGIGIHLPTSGLAILEFDVDHWDAVQRGTGRLREIATSRTIA